MTYQCGCINEQHSSGITRCVSKCKVHRDYRRKQPKGLAYYQMLGSVTKEGRPANTKAYVDQITDALGPLPPPSDLIMALEIGGGASPYVGWIQRAGYSYTGIEVDSWAYRWVQQTYSRAVVYRGSFPLDCTFEDASFGLVLSVHSLEHMKEAPAALRRMYKLLCPGGLLYIVVPDDRDPTNPDHFWFFNTTTLPAVLSHTGFKVEKMVTKKIVEHEDFIYCLARK